MKKYLFFIIPLVLWIACYFSWQVPLGEEPTGIGMWWMFNDVILGMGTVVGLIFSVAYFVDHN